MSQRTEQVGSVMQQILSQLIVSEVELPTGVIVSVLGVRVSADLRHARAKITIHPRNRQGQALAAIKQQLPHIRRELADQMTTKFTPRLTIMIDPAQEKADRINELLDGQTPKG